MANLFLIVLKTKSEGLLIILKYNPITIIATKEGNQNGTEEIKRKLRMLEVILPIHLVLLTLIESNTLKMLDPTVATKILMEIMNIKNYMIS